MTIYRNDRQYARAKQRPISVRRKRTKRIVARGSERRDLDAGSKARVRAAYEALGLKPPAEAL